MTLPEAVKLSRRIVVSCFPALLIAGCSPGPDARQVASDLTKLVLQVPGVTGGAVTIGFATFETIIGCSITGASSTKLGLIKTLEDAIKVILQHAPEPFLSGTYRCRISNGDLSVSLADLNLGVSLVTGKVLIERYG